MTTSGYGTIEIAGGDTATPINLKHRVEIIADHCDLRGATFLDAGCGSGEYVAALANAGAVACGIEFAADKVAAWNEQHQGDTRVQQGDLAAIPFAEASFDAALLNEVIEHVPDERAVLGELARVIKPGGLLFVFSPNRRYPFEAHGAESRRTGRFISPHSTFGLPYLPLPLAMRLVRPVARNYWPGELRRLVTSAGFEITHYGYVWQTFENITGHQGPAMRCLAPLLRAVSRRLEATPIVRSLGVSQLIVARRRATSADGPRSP